MTDATTTVRVRYAETDQMGVVYHANYFVWFEVGRCELLRATGSTYRALEESGVTLPVIEAHCEYLQPGRYDDELEIRAHATLLSPVRLQFDYEVVRDPDRTLIARGRTVHAAIGPTGRPTRLPDHVKEVCA